MPLPEKAHQYLAHALLALKPEGGHVHYYDFEHAKKREESIKKVKEKVKEKLQKLNRDIEITSDRIVRGVGPNWYQVVLDITVSGYQ